MSTCASSKSTEFIPTVRGKPSNPNETVFNIPPKAKNCQIRSTYKSPNSTPTATPHRAMSRERTSSSRTKEHLKENINIAPETGSSGKIDLLIEKYKKDISNQSYRMQELKKNMQQYDHSIQNLLQNKTQESEKRNIYAELEKKNRELKERLNLLENSKETKIKQENQHLEIYLQEKIKAKSKLIQEIASIEEENSKIESSLSKYSKTELISTNKHLKATHLSLSAELKKLQNTCITVEEYSQLQDQIKDLEEMQNKLIHENNSLKEEIIKEQKIELAGHENNIQQRAMCREVAMIKKEISMLNCLGKSIFKGEQVDLSFILGAGPISEMEGKTLTEAILDINSELNTLKECILTKEKDNCQVF